MRREVLYLTDIVEACGAIAEFLRGVDAANFVASELVRSAVAQKLAIIGEAAAHIPESLRSRYAEVPWPKIVAFRNLLVHWYFGIDWDEVWLVAKERCPELGEQIARILAAEFE